MITAQEPGPAGRSGVVGGRGKWGVRGGGRGEGGGYRLILAVCRRGSDPCDPICKGSICGEWVCLTVSDYSTGTGPGGQVGGIDR